MKKDVKKMSSVNIILIIIFIIVLGLIFGSPNQLPDNCRRTPSVDVGGSEIECD